MELRQELIENIESSISKLQDAGLNFEEVVSILKARELDKNRKTLPVSIFNNSYLSALEAIVKYLKENLALNYSEIALLLGRNYDPIAITYRNARRKMPSSLDISSKEKIPVEIFRETKVSILENLSSYMKDSLGFNYHQIALFLNRDERTIWTVYNRAQKKRKNGIGK